MRAGGAAVGGAAAGGVGRPGAVLRRLVDDALWGAGTPRRLAFVRSGLAVVIGLRVGLGSYRQLAELPDALFDPVPVLGLLDGMPSAGTIVAIQVVGVVAAGLAAFRRWPRATFAVAWLAYLVLAGLRGSRGKVLHNDLLLLWTSAALLLAPAVGRGAGAHDRRPSRAFGWPVRTATAVGALVYFFAGFHKLRRSGPGWVLGDNIQWVMRWGPSVGSSPLQGLTDWVGAHSLAAIVSAAFIVGVELTFPLVIWHPRVRPLYAAAAVVLHVGTWLLLGLDYWAWALTMPLLLVDWPAVLDRVRAGRDGPVTVATP
ncbi:MAG: hypothetical protein AB7H43_14760 [Acidimicrobiia bacterium]